jgi:hypothetical protein
MNTISDEAEAASIELLPDIETPKLKELREALADTISTMEIWQDRVDLAEDSSWCVWPGQSDDGKKRRASEADDPPFPWEGASDTRVRLVEEKVREADKICNAGFRRGRWDVIGRETTDAAWGRKMSVVLKWLVFTKMRPEFQRERKLAIDWRNRYGVAISWIEWEQRAELAMQDLDLRALAEMFGLGPHLEQVEASGVSLVDWLRYIETEGALPEQQEAYIALRDALDLVTNPEREREFVTVLAQVFPTVKAKLLRGAARELRSTGATRLPTPSVAVNRPRRRALLPGRHIFFPGDTRGLDTARWVAIREWLSEAELRSRSGLPDPEQRWNEDFVDEVLKHKGKSGTATLAARRGRSERWSKGNGSFESGKEDYSELYEVFHFYYRAVDDYGVQGLYKTVLSLHALSDEPDRAAPSERYYGWHGLLPYAHGKMPGIEHVFYRDSEKLLENAGIPWLLYTYQNEMKEQRDYRIDASAIGILPPVRAHIRDSGKALNIGPGRPVYESVRGSTEFMSPPNSRVDFAVSAERAIALSAARLVGSIDAELPTPLIALHQEDLITDYLDEEVEALTQIFQLAQQYLDEATVTRVTGAMPQPFKVSREEIQGQFDIEISFDPQEIDGQYALRKLDMITKVVRELDVNNVTDRNRLVELALQIIDPHYADALVLDPQAASLQEIEDEQKNLALILTGQEPAMKENGQNAQLRMQVMQAATQNPSIVQALQQDELKAQIFDNRMKHLGFLIQQRTNAQTGRVGAEPIVQPA